VIDRYTLPEIGELFTDEARLARWLEIELLATEAWAEIGVVPREEADAARRRAPTVDAELVAAVAAREAITDHDVAAFVDVVQGRIGPPAGNWIHFGLTSSDVVDTAQCLGLTHAADLLHQATGELRGALVGMAREHRDAPMMGRTHGIHAEPTTFGAKVALWALQVERDIERVRRAREGIAVGKLSGAVGTYSNIDPAVEQHVCTALGLRPVPSTQVVARDRHAELLWACASVGATVETIATEVRHLQRTEVGEVREGFAPGQKGSSAMPHKRNPILSERLTGLARILRANLGAGLENVALWHERDISHSSVERVILADSLILAYYVVRKAQLLVERLVVDTERMRSNIDLSHGLVFSQPVLLALVRAGFTRDDAYQIVQRNALAAWDQQKPFRVLLEADPEMTLDAAALDEAFSLERSLRHAGRTVDALDSLDALD
jgi:adenylosuccinate lyase